jgi:hypothetical protein
MKWWYAGFEGWWWGPFESEAASIKAAEAHKEMAEAAIASAGQPATVDYVIRCGPPGDAETHTRPPDVVVYLPSFQMTSGPQGIHPAWVAEDGRTYCTKSAFTDQANPSGWDIGKALIQSGDPRQPRWLQYANEVEMRPSSRTRTVLNDRKNSIVDVIAARAVMTKNRQRPWGNRWGD